MKIAPKVKNFTERSLAEKARKEIELESKNGITRSDWLARCENVYNLGIVQNLAIVRNYADYCMRKKAGQDNIADDILERDRRRSPHSLRADIDAYVGLEAIEILSKECQACAVMPDAWHTRNCSFGCKT